MATVCVVAVGTAEPALALAPAPPMAAAEGRVWSESDVHTGI